MDDLALRWRRLYAGLKNAARIKDPTELDVVEINSLLGAVNLIQPFDWNAWAKPFPATEEIGNLSLEDCVRQITRIVRADRTQEGVLWMSIRSGAMFQLTAIAHRRANGEWIPSLAKLSSDS